MFIGRIFHEILGRKLLKGTFGSLQSCRSCIIKRLDNKLLTVNTNNPEFGLTMIGNSNSITNIPTAGIIVIGDELLKGQIADVNTHFLTENLYKLGVKVQKVSIIPDDVLIIAEEISTFSKLYTHVITSGGIGPTHDDVTFEGVASAFGENLVSHNQIVEFIKQWYKTEDLKSPAMKMAKLPESAVLYYGEDKESGMKSKFPCVRVRNVVVFPGIPHLLQKSFKMLGEKIFVSEGCSFHTRLLFLSSDEVTIAEKLNEAVSKFPRVSFGSYPDYFHSYYRTKVTLESLQKKLLEEAESFLLHSIGKDIVVEYTSDTLAEPWSHLNRFSPHILSLFEAAIDILKQTFDKYMPEEVILCFNGGKDCLVVLHIVHCFIQKFFPGTKIQALYIKEKNAFPEVTQFAQQTINRYGIDCEILQGPMKPALFHLLKSRPAIKAVVMGTRNVDPHGDQLNVFSPTDGDWPELMRVNPILEWKYEEVWSFIRALFLPYCSLYDRGYTSLGNLDNTLPNPSLETTDALGRVSFLPAHRLQDASQERRGRFV